MERAPRDRNLKSLISPLLTAFVKDEYKSKRIFPPAKQIFNAFNFCSFDDCKVSDSRSGPVSRYWDRRTVFAFLSMMVSGCLPR
jgi:hypothetical protein